MKVVKFNAVIKNRTTGEIVKRVECRSERSQQSVVIGMCINLNHNEYEALYEDIMEDGTINYV